jgi:hypothetical protein
VLVFLQAAVLGNMPKALTSQNAVWQKSALKQLQWVLRMRQAFGEPVVQKLAEAGILTALVQVLQPGSDACESQNRAAASMLCAAAPDVCLCRPCAC